MAQARNTATTKQQTTPEELPDAELEVLACLWQRGPATAAEIRDWLEPFRPLAHGSVLTLLKRLRERGLVTREKSGRGKAFVFRPTQRPRPAYRRILGRLTRRVFGGDPVTVVASLLESRAPTPAEIRRIRQLLDDLERE